MVFEVDNPDGYPSTKGENLTISIEYIVENGTSSGTLHTGRTKDILGAFEYFSNTSLNFDYQYTLDDIYTNDAAFFEFGAQSEYDILEAVRLDNFAVSGVISGYNPFEYLNEVPPRYDFWSETTDSGYFRLSEMNSRGEETSTIVRNLDLITNSSGYWRSCRSEVLNYPSFLDPPPVPGGIAIPACTFTDPGPELEKVRFTTDLSENAFIAWNDDIYKVDLSANYVPQSGTYNETNHSGIGAASGVLPLGAVIGEDLHSFSYNSTNGEFLQYAQYFPTTTEVIVRTLSISGGALPTPSTREVFLDIPDWDEHDHYELFLHGVDHNTLFYLRRQGNNKLNSDKSIGTAATLDPTVPTGHIRFEDSAANFVLDHIQIGDIIEGDYIPDGDTNRQDFSGVVTQIINETAIVFSGSANEGADANYSIASNAELKQFNIDSSISAFASLNVDDFSLAAGTAETTTARAEVINAWGDPLQGKSVAFSVTQGDGFVTPAGDTTDAAGEATTTYSVGTTPGPVEITAVISD
jgi:hypothetical protein